MKRFRRKFRHKFSTQKIVGIVLIFTGILIILKVVPLNFWLFLIGLVIFVLGFYLIKCG